MIKKNSKIGGYKVIFVDINIPIKDGFETTKCIRKLYKEMNIKSYIIGVSGDSSYDLEVNCKEAGINKLCKVNNKT